MSEIRNTSIVRVVPQVQTSGFTLQCAPPYVNKHVDLNILFTITLHLKINSYLKRRVTFPITWADSSENHDALRKIYRKVTMIFVSFGVNLYKHTFPCALRPSKLLTSITLFRSVYVPKILCSSDRASLISK